MSDLTSILNQSIGKVALGDVLAAIVTLLLCMVVIRAVLKLTRKLLSRSRLDDRVQKYLASGIKLVLYVIAAIIVISSLGIDMTSLVALLSVASLGVTLAAEDVLANVAGGLVILSAHPFTIGDYIEASGTAGTVEEITLNYTKLVTPDGHLVMLPNKSLADSQMTNYTALGRRRGFSERKVRPGGEPPTRLRRTRRGDDLRPPERAHRGEQGLTNRRLLSIIFPKAMMERDGRTVLSESRRLVRAGRNGFQVLWLLS